VATEAKQHYDILVNGGGIVGAAFVCELLHILKNPSSSSLKIAILDPRPPPSLDECLSRTSPDLRVYALAPATVALLKKIGAWKYVEKRSQPYNAMHVWESEGPGMVEFASDEVSIHYHTHTHTHTLHT